MADVGAAVSVFSDSRFRGYSLSGGHPVAVVDLSYDDRSGLYASVSGSLVASSNDGIKPLEVQLGGGYARRVSGVTLDIGAVHSEYSRYGRWVSARSSTELYAGATFRFLSARLAYSPHYFEPGARTLYGEINANVSPLRKVHLAAHAGLLAPLGYRDSSGSKDLQYDWRIGVSRDVGRATFHLIGSGGGPGRDYYRDRGHSRNALIVGVSWAL